MVRGFSAIVVVATLVATLLASTAPAKAFNMRRALQAVENLGQWSVMAQKCGEPKSADTIRKSIKVAIAKASLSHSQRQRLVSELWYWVKTIHHNFRTGGLNVVTACPLWRDSGRREIWEEFARLHKQLG